MNIQKLQNELLILSQLAGLGSDDPLVALIEDLPLLPPELAGKEAQRLVEFLQPLAAASDIQPDPFRPYPSPADILPGDIEVGLLEGQTVAVPIEWFMTHVLVTGPPGTGKTFWVLNTLRHLIDGGVGVVVFDTQGDYSQLLPALCPKTQVIRFEDFRRNPFQGPPGTTEQRWRNHMSNYLREVFYFRDGLINRFRDICDRIAKADRPFNVESFLEQFSKLPRKTWKDQDHHESLRRFARTLEEDTYRCTQGFDLQEVFQSPVVFDLTGMADDLRLFFIADLVTYLKASRSYRMGRQLETVLVMDELSKFYSQEAAQRSDMGEPFVLELARTSRKQGIGLILADQTYATIHKVIRACCVTKIVLETIDGVSKMEIARDLSLDRDQQAFLGEISTERRRLVARIPTFPRPLLLEMPELVIPDRQVRYEPPDLDWTGSLPLSVDE